MKALFIAPHPANIPEFLPEVGAPNTLLYGLLGLLFVGILFALIQYRRVGSES